MKIIGICNNKGRIGKTTICLCLASALAETNKKVLQVDMDQQGSLSSSFLLEIHNLPFVITDALRDNQTPIREIVQKTAYEKIDIIPANFSLGKLEIELIS